MPRIPLFLALLALALPVTAQPGSFGVGGQIGEPTGLTIKFRPGPAAFDAAAEWDFNDHIFVQGHLILSERRFQGSPVGYYYGPGLFIGARNNADTAFGNNADTAFGLSFNAAVNYYTGPIEFFGHVTPRLRLTPGSDFDIGPAFGIRFYP